MQDVELQPSPREERPVRVNLFHQIWVVMWVGAVLATLYTAWTPLGLFPIGWAERVAQLFAPQATPGFNFPTPTARPLPVVGIVAGHWGNDSGAVCPDGLTEAEVNLEIATRVKENLEAQGFEVDLLQEFDERLTQYRALALVSIHTDSCQFVNTEATGFKVAAALASSFPEKANRLVACIHSRYQAATELTFHAGSITPDMTSYHAFGEIHSDTTAAIIEVGFLNLDRQILTEQPDLIARAVSDGILCFIRNESAPIPPTAIP